VVNIGKKNGSRKVSGKLESGQGVEKWVREM